MGVFRKLLPQEFLEDLSSLDVDRFFNSGRDVFIFDFDNTLGYWRSQKIEERFQLLLKKILSSNGKIIIASNGKPRQISLDGVDVIWRVRKPFTKKIKESLLSQGIDVKRVVLIGDQIFTDVLAGNLLGAYTVKVKPLSKTEFFGTKVLRVFERVLFLFLRKR
ncbi:YqeG family HAD IIIA-type phosphatase [Pseudothermotoga sp. U03pept]|uniref:YqeG family HAD IIIA-type phosphatase n=1 Tax=Pseudothermotoga sp. U03pept TaxID=3447012 RepID=UPI003F0FAE7B